MTTYLVYKSTSDLPLKPVFTTLETARAYINWYADWIMGENEQIKIVEKQSTSSASTSYTVVGERHNRGKS